MSEDKKPLVRAAAAVGLCAARLSLPVLPAGIERMRWPSVTGGVTLFFVTGWL